VRGNPNPVKARLAKALKAKAGDLGALRQRVWGVLEVSYADVAEAATPDDRRRAILAFVQVAATYNHTYETGEIEARLKMLEQALAQAERET
jgi:hypothetical protein